ncbi:hypothetical protein L6R52_34555, partial [Myxococcota bacterium]|nr:hypothetical protein [Myxococcota bacterium]
SCHPDAGDDRSLHDIGQAVPRPTLSTRGIARTAPYLRGASYARIGGLEHFAMVILGGWRTDDPGRVAALEAYVASLPPVDAEARLVAPDPARLRAGVDAFVRAGCDTCHAFPAFTDLAQYPVPFLFPERDELELVDTPSLFGVGASAPYLHDARAETLDAVLDDALRGGRHGDVARLTPDERRSLVALLEAL